MSVPQVLKNRKFQLFILGWLAMSFAAAGLAELYNDEAYYWVYSRYLAWGYFDHPPVIALLIKAGYGMVASELGARFFIVIGMAVTIFFIYRVANVENMTLLVLIVLSAFPFHLFGFVAVPDSPFILCTALYFFMYDRYLKNDTSVKIALWFGLVMAAMLYAKYHGVLVILFTLISNPALFRKKTFWLASIFGALLFVPHLYWQYVHDFPSVQYHLVDRSAKAYQLNFTLEYVGGQLLYYGPFIGFFLYWAAFRREAANLLERALKFTVIGTLIFFFASTVKGRVEVNWTIAMLVPMTILAMRHYQENPKQRAWLYRVAYVSIPVILLVRIHTVFPFADFKKDRTADFRGHRAFAEAALKAAAGRPLVGNRYQTAASLSFYTKQQVPVFNINGRFSQYDLWKFDSVLVNKSVAFVNQELGGAPLPDDYVLTPMDSFPVFKFMSAEIARGPNDTYILVVKSGKPSSFYAFTKKYPLIINIQVLGEDGSLVHMQSWPWTPQEKTTISFKIPKEIEEKSSGVFPSVSTPSIGILREYKSVNTGS